MTGSSPTPMILGVQYERLPNPRPADWERDLKRIAELRLALIRTWMYWRTVNPQPGQWVWEHYDRLLDLAHQHGLQVQIQLFCEAPPEYLIRQHPEWAYLNEEGKADRYYRRAAQQVGGFQGFDYAHPEARAAATDYIRRVVERYGRHPALSGYDVWNELWMSQWLDSPSSRALRIEFLKRKYGDLARLNGVWCHQHTAWDQIEDPRASEPLGLKRIREGLHVDHLDMIEFENWIRGWHLRWRCDAVRQADARHPVMAHAGCGDVLLRTNAWLTGSLPDVWGVSCYSPDLNECALTCHACAATAQGNPWWLAENCSGRSGYGFQAVQRPPGFLRAMHTLALMHGVQGDVFWQYRPEIFGPEAPNYGLVGLNGEPTARSECVAALAQVHREQADVLGSLRFGEPQVGLVYSPRCAAFQQMEGTDFCGNFAAWYRALCHRGFVPALLQDEQVAARGVPFAIRMLVAPMQLIRQRGLRPHLEQWVRDGGTLIGGPFFELFDEDLRAGPVCPGTDLFGVRQVDFNRQDRTRIEFANDQREAGALVVSGPVEKLAVTDAQVVGVCGDEAVITVRRVGRGRAIYVGCLAGLAADAATPEALGTWVEAIGKTAGVERPACATGGCLYRWTTSSQGGVMLIVNPTQHDLTTGISVSAAGASSAVDLLRGEPLGAPPRAGAWDVTIPAQDARIILFCPTPGFGDSLPDGRAESAGSVEQGVVVLEPAHADVGNSGVRAGDTIEIHRADP